MFHRLRQWLTHLLHPSAAEEQARRLAAESELQSVRIDLAHANQQILQAGAERGRQGQEEAAAIENHLAIQLEELLTSLATPLTQLLTQQHLIEREGKELGTKDLLATSRRIWQGLAPFGVEVLESIGEVVPYDPDRHLPLSQGSMVGAGTPVRVRIPGLLLKGRVLKSAAVEPLPSQEPGA
ncbi:MAG: hypothetical protein ACKOOC_09240 [Cyanobium sp.]